MSVNLGTMFVSFDAMTAGFHSKAVAVGKGIESVGDTAKKIGTSLSLSITAPATIAAGIATKAFTTFDGKLRNVNTIARLSEEELKGVSGQLMDMAIQMGKAPSGLADSLYDIYSSGFSGAEAMEMLQTVTTAASAGLASAADAGKGVMAVLNAYGLSARDAADVSDIMFKTVERGVLTFPELAANVGDVVSTAATARVPFDQIGAAMATMTKGGINASESAVALNAMLLRIVKGSDELTAAFRKEVGMTASQSLQNLGLAATMQTLTKLAGGNIDEFQRLGFETRDLKAATSLTRNEGKAFAEDLAEIANKSSRAGAAQAAFAEQTKSFGHALEKTKGVLYVAAIELASSIAPVLLRINSYIQQAIGWWRGLGEGTKQIVVTFIALAAAAGPVLLFSSKLLFIFSTLAPWMTGLARGLATVVRWFGAVGGMGGVVTAVWTSVVGLASAIASVALPVAAVAAAIAGLIYWLVSAYGEGDTFGQKLGGVWDAVVGWASRAWEAVQSFGRATIGFFQNFGQNVGILWNWMRSNWMNVLGDMAQLVTLYVVNTISNWVNLATKIGAIVGVLAGWLKDNWKEIAFGLVDAFLSVLIKMGEVARSIADVLWEGIKAGLSGGDFNPESIVQKIADAMYTGFVAKGTIKDRLKEADILGGWKGPFEGFESSITEMPKLNLDSAVKPAEKVKTALEAAAAAQAETAIQTKKTADAMNEVWKGAGAATENSVEAAKSIVRFLNMKAVPASRGTAGPATPSPIYAPTQDYARIGTDIAERALRGGPSVSTPSYMPSETETPAGAMILQEAMLGELTAMRSSLEGINATIVSEPALS